MQIAREIVQPHPPARVPRLFAYPILPAKLPPCRALRVV
jgi:hypothetical protein